MNRSHRLLIVLAFVVASVTAVQGQNEIVANPKAVALKRVWSHFGAWQTQDQYGGGAVSLPDIDSNGAHEFAVWSAGSWYAYWGKSPAPDSAPFWSFRSLSSLPPCTGDFFGDGEHNIVFNRVHTEVINGSTQPFSELRLFKTDHHGIADSAALVFDPMKLFPPIEVSAGGVAAVNLDGRTGDELIYIIKQLRRGNDPWSDTTQVWIFKGGADFQLDSPTVIIKDAGLFGSPDQFTVNLQDIDGDGKLDMALSGLYPGVGPMVRFYWGDDRSPYSWAERPPDRDVKITQDVIGLNGPIFTGNFDGDSVMDFVGYIYTGDHAGVYVYLSSRGKSARTRSFMLDDADVYFSSAAQPSQTTLGYLNDPTHRYEMLSLDGEVGLHQTARLGISGGPDGPDNTYEAYYSPGLDGIGNSWLFVGGPVADVTGDGYDDVIYGAPSYNSDGGVAYILAGGPYIPRDSASLGVRDVAVAGRQTGLSFWPNPVHDELNIAWRGDLKRMPARFEVHDLLGRLVAAGSVESWRGAALWRCEDVPAGTYLLLVYDHSGNMIASTELIKQ
jgi:hypothetical protein